jgi:hypothetical protein
MTRYPLSWPAGWPRTAPSDRKGARFSRRERQYSSTGGSSWTRKQDLSVADAVKRVLSELRTLGVPDGDAIISTNVPTRLDGLPRSSERAPADPGVAIYWQRPTEPMRCMAIDIYNDVAGNLAAIAATLEAMRAIERHGGAQILDRAFAGFDALPAPGGKRDWRDVLGIEQKPGRVITIDDARSCYRQLAAKHHPDRGGSSQRMAEINAAWAEAQAALGQ